ncbi:C5a anaphylatoxin chemotactic receptor 1-like [Leptodactylus fuscus]
MVPADSVLTLLNITEDDYNWSYYTEYEPRDTTYDYYENILEKISLTLKIIIFVLGIIGNGLVIWIAGFRMKKTISAVWFLHLAIADFLFCAGLSLNVALELQIFLFTPKVDLFCLLYIIMFTLNMSASILLLTAMSIDRCVSVMWPFWAKVHRTRRLVRITAGGIWGLSLLITSLIYYIHRWCLISGDYIDSLFRRSLSENIDLIRLVIMFVIPFLIILTSYLIIFLRLRKSKRPQRSQRLYRIITAVPCRPQQRHNVGAVSTSRAERSALSIDQICTAASWASESTFIRHYRLKDWVADSTAFAQTVLSSVME